MGYEQVQKWLRKSTNPRGHVIKKLILKGGIFLKHIKAGTAWVSMPAYGLTKVNIKADENRSLVFALKTRLAKLEAKWKQSCWDKRSLEIETDQRTIMLLMRRLEESVLLSRKNKQKGIASSRQFSQMSC